MAEFNFYEEIKASLEDAVAYKNGDLSRCRVHVREVPDPEYKTADIAQEIAYMVDMLPAEDQRLAYALVKKLVLAWDPDFTKVTPGERERIDRAEAGGYVADSVMNAD